MKTPVSCFSGTTGLYVRYMYICLHAFVAGEPFHSPLALAGMENQVLVVLGADGELVLGWVEDVEQQMTLAGAVDTAGDRRISISTQEINYSLLHHFRHAHTHTHT